MTLHTGPHFTVAPDDQRCEALVPAKSRSNACGWEWLMRDHRCSIRAQSGRMGRRVCYQHSRVKASRLRWWKGRDMPETKKVEAGRKVLLETIDLTPTWSGLVQALVTMLVEGNPQTRQAAIDQMDRMARAADAWISHVRASAVHDEEDGDA